MKKKLITALLLSMIVCMVGCGKTAESETLDSVVETSIEEMVEESVVEETSVEEIESVVEEITVEETMTEETTQELEEDSTSTSNATAQIIKLLDAYKSIMNGDDVHIKMAQDNCETYNGKWDVQATKFADGKTVEYWYTILSIAIEYYENCLTGGEPWDDTVTWMAEQACEEDVLMMNFNNPDSIEEGFETKLFEAIYICPYLANQSSIELKNRIETNEYKFVKGEVSAYTYDLILNGDEDNNFTAIYDSEGNLLTIDIPDDYVLPEEYYSFEQ